MSALLIKLQLGLVAAMLFSVSPVVQSQPSTHRLFAAVLSNKRYVVGSDNPGAGLFASDTEKPTWRNLSFPNLRMFDFDILPNDGDWLFYTANGNGMIVSRDGGRSWRVTTGWQITEVLKIRAVPGNPAVVYIGTAYGAYRSTDFGETWKPISKRFVYALLLDRDHPQRLYLGEEDGLRLSDDGGAHLSPAAGLSAPVLVVAQHPVQRDLLLAGTEDRGIFLSTDRGQTWSQITDLPNPNATVYDFCFSPDNPNRILAGTFASGLFLSEDGGRRWRSLSGAMEAIPVSCLVAHPDQPGVFFAGTLNRGVFRSSDGGRSWQPFGLSGAQVMELEIHPVER